MRIRLMLGCLAIASAVACGKSPEQQRAEEIQENVQKNAQQLAQGFADMAKSMGAGDPNQKPIQPVGFRDLQTVFGDISGWEKGESTGEQMTMPVNFSQAKVDYTKGDAYIEVEVVDSGFNQMLMLPFAMMLTAGYERETSSGYEKSTTVGGYPGWEKWDTDDKDGELNAVVDKRFIVKVSGRNLDDARTLHTAIASVDMKKLTALNK